MGNVLKIGKIYKLENGNYILQIHEECGGITCEKFYIDSHFVFDSNCDWLYNSGGVYDYMEIENRIERDLIRMRCISVIKKHWLWKGKNIQI